MGIERRITIRLPDGDGEQPSIHEFHCRPPLSFDRSLQVALLNMPLSRDEAELKKLVKARDSDGIRALHAEAAERFELALGFVVDHVESWTGPEAEPTSENRRAYFSSREELTWTLRHALVFGESVVLTDEKKSKSSNGCESESDSRTLTAETTSTPTEAGTAAGT